MSIFEMKKYIAIILICCGILTLSACGKEEQPEIEKTESIASIMDENREMPEENIRSSEYTFSFSDLKNIEFLFASGAGAWSTTMTVKEDGTFSGVFHDSDMGSSGENYPNGTVYYCSFEGKFAEPEKVDEYSYKTSIEYLSFEHPEDTEEIINDTRYIYSNAYGLDDPKDILIYLPGMPTDALPEGYLSWVRSDLFVDYNSTELVNSLPFYGLYNVNAEQGFSSYNIIEHLKENVAFIEEMAAELEDSIMNDGMLKQVDLNMKSQELYEYWDYALNMVWDVLKKLLDEEEMSSLVVKQREWIVYKEQEAKAAGAEVEGGSMYGMIISLKAAELTKTRMYELLELLTALEK